jgi:hypothetical protein
MEENMNIKDVLNSENDRMVPFSDIGVPINPMPDFSDLYFRSMQNEYSLEDEYDKSDYFLGVNPNEEKQRDNNVIQTNANWWETSLQQLNGKGQAINEASGDVLNPTSELFEQISLKSPTEVDTEELPSNIGGATPRASNSASKSRGGSDLRTIGNPYGYA